METTLQNLQKGPTLIMLLTCMVGIRPKQFVNHHNYHVMKESKVQSPYDDDRYIGPYSTIEQQIRADAMLLRQIYEIRAKTI